VPAKDYSVVGHYNNDFSVQGAKYV
jgi:hypothetical protein